MLVCLFLSQILHDRFTSRSKRISSVQDVNDNVGGIQDFVQLAPYSTGSSLGVNGFTSK